MYLHNVMESLVDLFVVFVVKFQVLGIYLAVHAFNFLHFDLLLLFAELGHIQELVEEPLNVII